MNEYNNTEEISYDDIINIATDTATPPQVLSQLAEYNSPEILERVVRNKNTPSEVLLKLANHENTAIKTAAKNNPNFPKPPEKPKQKQWFLVHMEGEAPITVQFRVFAEDEEKAFEIIDKAPFAAQMDGRPQIDLRRMRKRKVSIKNLLNGMITWMKNF